MRGVWCFDNHWIKRAAAASGRFVIRASLLFLLAPHVVYGAEGCPEPPKLATTISVRKFYTDPAGSIPDPAIEAANQQAMLPFRQALIRLDEMADGWHMAQPMPTCAASWLIEWARSGVMAARPTNMEERYTVSDYAAGFSLAYLKVHASIALSERTRIEAWLAALAHTGMATFINSGVGHNNLYYWSAIAPAVLWLLTGNEELGQYARDAVASIAGSTTAEGRLQPELKRGRRALTYEAYALEGFLPVWRVLAAGGYDLPSKIAETVRHAALRTVEDACDPAQIADIAGGPQETIAAAQLAWVALIPIALQPATPHRLRPNNRWNLPRFPGRRCD